MKYSEEVLMAYAQGRLDEPERSEVERALRLDPVLAARVARHRTLRAHAGASFGAMADELSPRIASAAGKVVRLDAVRAARQQAQQPAPTRSRWAWRQWLILAAALGIGALEGAVAYNLMQGENGVAAVDGKGGAMVAQGVLAKALSRQAEGTDGKVTIGASFISKDGTYCRGFVFGSVGGVACHRGERWNIAVLAESVNNEIPKPVRDVIAQRIDGKPLDEQGQKLAERQGWRR